MFELVYLVCWSFQPVPMDCRIVRIKKETRAECVQGVEDMKPTAPAWCDTGREPKTVESWLKATDKKGEMI